MILVGTMKRSYWFGMYGILWIAVLWFLFAVPGWAPEGSRRGVAMAWFILQKGPAVLVLFLATGPPGNPLEGAKASPLEHPGASEKTPPARSDIHPGDGHFRDPEHPVKPLHLPSLFSIKTGHLHLFLRIPFPKPQETALTRPSGEIPFRLRNGST